MTFNWPDIPFSGTEVDAFVTEYKALAQAIYDDWDDDGEMRIYDFDPAGHDLPISFLKAPFRRRSTVKILLENGLVYAAFIVKQRAGNSGPGTDFELGNSPLIPAMTLGERYDLFSDLGCVFTPEAMECAYRKNNSGKNPPVDLGDPFDVLADGGIPNDDIDPDDPNIPTNDPDDPPEDCPNKNLRENALIGLANTPGPFSSCFRDVKAKLLDRYLSCDDSVFTENDIQNKIPNLRAAVQEFFDRTSNGDRQCNLLRQCVTKRLNITSNFSAEGKARMGVGPTDKIHEVSFYTDPGPRLCLHTAFGTAIVITSSSEQVLRILDDFDFVYGNLADRPDASYTGQPNPGKKVGTYFDSSGYQLDRWNNPVPVGHPTAKNSTIYPPATEISDVHGTQNWTSPTEIGRNIVADNYLNGDGKGQPVPVNINLQE